MNPRKWFRQSVSVASATVLFLSLNAWVLPVDGQSAAVAVADSPSSVPSAPFVVARSFALASAPTGVAMGDLNLDGKLDLVAIDTVSGNATVFLGSGDGKFGAGTEYATGVHPTAVAIADLNGDGRQEVIVCDQAEGRVAVLVGSGDGRLAVQQNLALGIAPGLLAVGDFNGDGKADVVVASNSVLAILLNDGKGNLLKPISVALAKVSTALAVADFNRDGHADLALGNADGTISLLLGTGTGKFRSISEVGVGTGPLTSVAAIDFSRDGKPGLAVTESASGRVSVLLGNGDGTFQAAQYYSVGRAPVSVVGADFDGDGNVDLIAVNRGSNTFSVLGGNGDGTFKGAVDFVVGKSPIAAVAGDFDGDGRIDLALVNHDSESISLAMGNGDDTFRAARSYSAGIQPRAIASADLNGDKLPDLAVANYCGSDATCGTGGSVAVFLAAKDGSYQLSKIYPVGAGPVSVALVDVNGDKIPDIVTLNREDKSVSLFLGRGDGNFEQSVTYSLAEAPIAVSMGDFNKDGKPDIAVLEDCGSKRCSQPGSVEILFGDGGGFQSTASYPVGYSPASIAAADLNQDKNLDLVVANQCGEDTSCKSAGTATVLLGSVTGKFEIASEAVLGKGPTSIALPDLSGRGIPDLVAARTGDNTISVQRGNGDGTFGAATAYKVGNAPGSVTVADFNGDGKPDVAIVNAQDSTVSVFFGKGDGTLGTPITLPVGAGPESLAATPASQSGHSGLITANGNSGSPTPGRDITVLSNFAPDLNSGLGAGSGANGSGPATLLIVSAPASTVAGAPFSVTVTAEDADGNIASGYSGTVHFASTDSAAGLLPTGNYTFVPAKDHGVHTFTNGVTLVTAGSQNVTATDAGTKSIRGSATVKVKFRPDGNPPLPSYVVTVTTDDATGTASNCVDQNVGDGDNSNCSLRDALAAAAASSGATITFSVSGNVQVLNGVLTIPSSTAIQGPTNLGDNLLDVDASHSSAVFLVGTGTTGASIANLDVHQGSTSGNGGCIVNLGSLTITASSIDACTSAQDGAGIYNKGTLVVTHSLIDGNTSLGSGAGIYNDGGTLTVTDSTFSGNTASSAGTGGGIASTGTLTAVNNTISGNKATLGGGVFASGMATYGNNIVSGNTNPEGTDDCFGTCPTNGPNGNLIGGTALLAALGPIGGVTETILPEPGSPAICAGSATLASSAGLTTDQRGFPITGGGYCPSGTIDAGAVQTAYSLLFTTQPPTGLAVDTVFSTTVTAYVSQTEVITYPANGPGIALTASAGTLKGTTSTVPVSPSGEAAFSGLLSTPVTNAKLTATLVLNPALSPAVSIKTTYSNFTVVADNTTTAVTLTSGANPSSVGQSLTFTAKVTPAGPPNASNHFVPTGTVSFAGAAAIVTACSGVPVTDNGDGTVSAACSVSNLPASGTAYTISATYASGDTNFNGSSGNVSQTVSGTAGTTTVVSVPTGANPSKVDGSVTFTATVAPITGNFLLSSTSSDKVTFTDNGNPISKCGTNGVVSLAWSAGAANATAACATNALIGGSHSIVATYSGDSNYLTSSNSLTQSVTALSTTVATPTLISPSPTVNQSVTVSATVSASSSSPVPFSGSMAFFNNGNPISGCSAITVNTTTGVAQCTISAGFAAGTYPITAQYNSGDVSYSQSLVSGALSLIIGQTGLTITVKSSPTSPTVNQPVTFTASLAATQKLTNTVSFTDNGTAISGCSAQTVSSTGVATCTDSSLTATTPLTLHKIVATYAGDSNYSASSGTLTGLAVTPGSTSVTLGSSTNPSGINQTVIFTATVAPNPSGNVGLSIGTVGFTDNGATISGCTAQPLTSNAATCTTSALVVGSHTIQATYSNDPNFTGSSSSGFAQTVNKTSLQVGLTSNAAGTSTTGYTSTVDTSILFSVSVQIPTGYPNPKGTLQVTDNGNPIATCPTSLTTHWDATCTVPSLTAGVHTIVAAYTGDPNASVANGTITLTVSAAASTTALSSNLPTSYASSGDTNPAKYTVTFTAMVTPAGQAVPLSKGTVAFIGVGTACSAQAVTVNSATGVGTATCTTTTLASGTDTITGTYSGDPNYASSTNSIPEKVEDYQINIANVPSGTLGVQVTQGYATGQTTLNPTAAVDPFPPSPQPAVTSVSTAGFFTAAGHPATIESCASSAAGAPVCIIPPATAGAHATLQITSSDTNGGIEPVVGITIDATSAKPGTYTFTVEVMDPTTTITRMATFPVTVRTAKTGSSNQFTIDSGATTNNSSPVTFNVPPGVTLSFFKCLNISGTGITAPEVPGNVGVACSFSPDSVATSPYTTTVTVTTSGTIAAAKPSAIGNRGPALLVAGVFTLPFFGLFGILRKRKSFGTNVIRLIAIGAVLIAGMQAIGCGSGGYTGKSTVVTGGTTPAGIYYLEIQGTGSDGNSYQTVLQVNVNL